MDKIKDKVFSHFFVSFTDYLSENPILAVIVVAVVYVLKRQKIDDNKIMNIMNKKNKGKK